MADKPFNLTDAWRTLMRAIQRGEVEFWPSWGHDPHRAVLSPPGGRRRVVTNAVYELERAGLVRCDGPGRSAYHSRRYWLTDAGRDALQGGTDG